MCTIAVLGMAVATYYWSTLVQYVFHRAFGHRKRLAALYRIHLAGHHALYPPTRLVSERFVRPKERVGKWFLLPMLPVTTAVGLLLPLPLFAAHVVALALSFWLHYWLHRQYHLARSPLDRFAWFDRKRRLHFLHHRAQRRNFAIIEFWWDRVFGTYAAAAAAG